MFPPHGNPLLLSPIYSKNKYIPLVKCKSTSLRVSLEMTHRKCVRKTVSLNLTEKYVLKIEVPSLDWEPPSCLCIVP